MADVRQHSRLGERASEPQGRCIDESERQRMQLQLDQLRHAAEFAPGAWCAELEALGRHAERAGLAALALEAMTAAAVAWGLVGGPLRAKSLLDEGRRSLRRLGGEDDAGRWQLELARAATLRADGRQDACLRTWMEVAADPSPGRAACQARAIAMLRLAEYGAMWESTPDVDRCLALADARWQESGEPESATFLVARACLALERHLWSAPDFDSLVLPQLLPQSRRQALLVQVQRDCEQARACKAPAATPLETLVLSLLDQLTRAWGSDPGASLLQANRLLLDADLAHPEWRHRLAHLVAGTCLVRGRETLAERIIAWQMAASGPGQRPLERTVPWLHLRSLVDQAKGSMESAIRCYAEYAQSAARYKSAVTFSFAAEVARLGRPARRGAPDAEACPPDFIEKAIELLVRTDEAPPTVADVARQIGISPRTLCTAFQEHCGASPKQYALQARLQAARDFSASGAAGSLTVAELARRFGFSNPSRFSARFRQAFRHPLRMSPPPRTDAA